MRSSMHRSGRRQTRARRQIRSCSSTRNFATFTGLQAPLVRHAPRVARKNAAMHRSPAILTRAHAPRVLRSLFTTSSQRADQIKKIVDEKKTAATADNKATGSRVINQPGLENKALKPEIVRSIPIKTYSAPAADVSKQLPRKFRELTNETLSVLAAQGNFGARKERFLREIMRVEDVSWYEAKDKLREINVENDKFRWLITLPYKISIGMGMGGAAISLPLVFHKETVLWFNARYVGEEVPENLSNFYEVGAWSWTWMEPVLGTLSFVLLGMQLARAHMQKIHMKPFSELILTMRANRLARHYPQYERQIVRDFSKSDPFYE